MPSAPLNEAEVNVILAASKRIEGLVKWSQKTNTAWFEAAIEVKHDLAGLSLSVRITVNIFANSKYSVTLILNGQHVIRRLCVGTAHANLNGGRGPVSRDPHEHRWSDAYHDRWADPVPDPGGPEQALLDFCSRAGIIFAANWDDPPLAQLSLEEP